MNKKEQILDALEGVKRCEHCGKKLNYSETLAGLGMGYICDECMFDIECNIMEDEDES